MTNFGVLALECFPFVCRTILELFPFVPVGKLMERFFPLAILGNKSRLSKEHGT